MRGVNPLPSPTTSSSSSGELPLFIENDPSSPSVPIGPLSLSQQLLLQGSQLLPPVPQSQQLLSLAQQLPFLVQQPPTQFTQSSSWADEVAAEQSDRSTPEKLVPNLAYSGPVRGPRTRSQPLTCPSPVMPTPLYFSTTTPSHRYGPTTPPLRPQPNLPQPPPHDRPASTDNYHCTDLFPRDAPELCRTRSTRYVHHPYSLYRPHYRQPGTPLALHEAHIPILKKAESTLSPPHKECYTEHLGLISY